MVQFKYLVLSFLVGTTAAQEAEREEQFDVGKHHPIIIDADYIRTDHHLNLKPNLRTKYDIHVNEVPIIDEDDEHPVPSKADDGEFIDQDDDHVPSEVDDGEFINNDDMPAGEVKAKGGGFDALVVQQSKMVTADLHTFASTHCETKTKEERLGCYAFPIQWYSPTCESFGYTYIGWEICGVGGRYICQKTWQECNKQTCVDSPVDWFDSDGATYDCDWYADRGHRCQSYGYSFRNFNKTANEACCVCGGGSHEHGTPSVAPSAAPSTPTLQPTSLPTSNSTNSTTCVDSPVGWYDSGGSNFTCDWYAQEDFYSGQGYPRCQSYGYDYRNFNKTANEACCACGGGSNVTGNNLTYSPFSIRRSLFETVLNYFYPQSEEDKLDWQK